MISGGVASLLLFIFRDQTLSAVTALLALVIVWLGLAPGFSYLLTPRDERPPFPLMPLTGLFYAAFFGLPAFLSRPLRHSDTGTIRIYGQELADGITPEAELLVIAGLVLMLAAYGLSKRTVWRAVPHFTLPRTFAQGRLHLLLWGLAVGHLAYLWSPAVHALPSVGQFLQPVGYLALAMFYVLWRRGELPRWQAAGVFLVLLPLVLIKVVASGFLTPLLMIGVFFAVLQLWLRGRVPWVTMLALPAFFMIAYPLMPQIRVVIWTQGQELTALQKVEAAIDMAGRFYFPDGRRGRPLPKPHAKPEKFGNAFLTAGLVQRVSLLPVLVLVVDNTPEPVPYWGGETYRPFFTSMIPRAVWPGKPEERTGNAFPRRYGWLPESSRRLSINLPWLTEMYANFGRIGIILGMALVGVLFGFLERFLDRPTMTPLEFVTGTTILLPLFFQESNFSLMTGSLLPLTASLWIYFTVGLRLPLPRLRVFSRNGR